MTTDVLALSELRTIVEAQNDKATWRQGTFERCHVFVPDTDSLGGTVGERVILRANLLVPHVENIAAIVALHNAAPVLLDVVAAALALEEAKRAAAAMRQSYFASGEESLLEGVDMLDRTEIACRDTYRAALARVRR